jgi:hypothetical protein
MARTKKPPQCNFHCCQIPEDIGERIRESVEAGRGLSMFDQGGRKFGPNCRCGIHRKPPGLARHVADDGLCPVHPDREPQPWSRGAN